MVTQSWHVTKCYSDVAESVKSAAGQLTEKTVARHSQMLASGDELKRSFDVLLAERKNVYTRKSGGRKTADLAKVITILKREKLFDTEEGRHHESFADFKHTFSSTDAARLKRKIIEEQKEIVHELNMPDNNCN